jgi:Helicase conserved C-terminal domain
MKVFKQELLKRTPQQLEEICHLWGMDGLSNKGTQNRQEVLLTRVKDPIAGRFLWENLLHDERQVLYRTLGHSARSGTRLDATMKKSQLSETSFAAVISSLERRLLLWQNTVKIRTEPYPYSRKTVATVEDVALLYPYQECAEALYTAGKEQISSKSDRSQMPLEKLLTMFYPGYELDNLGQRYGLEAGNYYTRIDLRTMISDELTQPNGAFEIIQRLSSAQRDILKWLCEQGGIVSMEAVRKHTGYDDNTLYNTLHGFEEYALAFDTFTAEGRVLFVPSDSLESLKKAATMKQPLVELREFGPMSAPPPVILPGENSVIYDLAVITGAIYQQTIEPTQAGKVPKRIATKIRPMLHGKERRRYIDEDDEYLDMLFNIAVELGIIRLAQAGLEGVKPHYEPGLQMEQWSKLDIVEQTRRMLECWSKSFRWMDIVGVHFKQWDPYSWNPIKARSSIVEHLQECLPGQWYSVASLLQKVWDKDAFELRPIHYNVRNMDRAKTSSMRTKWSGSDGEYYIGLLSSSLSEFGMVTLGFKQLTPGETGEHKNPDAFMLTELGSAVLAKEPEPAAQPAVSPLFNGNGTRALVLQPNFDLLLLHPDMPTLYSLLPFAAVNQVNMVSKLTLTRNSVLRGMEAGVTIDKILHVLETSSQKEVPQNVAYTLRDWVKLYKDVKISQVLLIEVSSETVADELCASSKLKKYNLRKIGGNILASSNDINVTDLRRAFEKEGIAVRISGDIITTKNPYATASRKYY